MLEKLKRQLLSKKLACRLLCLLMVTSLLTTRQATAAFPQIIVFDTPAGQHTPGPAQPRQEFQFTFSATPGDQLSFATMLMESNDFFYSPNAWGIALFDSDGQPLSQIATKYVNLWDAGTEVNEEPTAGPHQPARQSEPNSGARDPDRRVRYAHDNFQRIGKVEQIVRVWIHATGGDNFLVQIQNLSGNKTLSPGVALIHREYAPLFEPGMPDRGQGLEALAEDGNPYPLANTLRRTLGAIDAVPGMPAVTPTATQPPRAVVFDTPVGKTTPAVLQQYETYRVEFTARPGDQLSFAAKVPGRTDHFLAPAEWGIALFGADGKPQGGVITDQILLWDAGTKDDSGAPDPDRRVRRVSAGPSAATLVFAWIDVLDEQTFVLNVLNVAPDQQLSPGVLVLHRTPAPLFQTGQSDRGLGLKTLAEDGKPYQLAERLR